MKRVLCCVRIENIGFSIYPNPSKDYISINSTVNISTYSIFTVDGNILYTNTFSNMIKIQELIDGIYILKLQTENGEFIYHRFIKN